MYIYEIGVAWTLLETDQSERVIYVSHSQRQSKLLVSTLLTTASEASIISMALDSFIGLVCDRSVSPFTMFSSSSNDLELMVSALLQFLQKIELELSNPYSSLIC